MCLFHCSEIAALRLSRSQAAASYNLDSDRYRLEDMFLRAAWDSWVQHVNARPCARSSRPSSVLHRPGCGSHQRHLPRSPRIPGILASQRGRGLASSWSARNVTQDDSGNSWATDSIGEVRLGASISHRPLPGKSTLRFWRRTASRENLLCI